MGFSCPRRLEAAVEWHEGDRLSSTEIESKGESVRQKVERKVTEGQRWIGTKKAVSTFFPSGFGADGTALVYFDP